MTDPSLGGVLVRCEEVARTFGTGAAAVVAVRRVSCEIRAGWQLAVTGPSGSGKSTLLHLLAAWTNPRSAGSRGLHSAKVRHSGPGRSPWSSRAPACSPRSTCRRTWPFRSLGAKLPEELSGGQSQRVAVAWALAGRPRLILADEPTGQLDHATAASVMSQLLIAAAESGAALVVSTHDPRVADRLAQRWQMADGQLLRPALAGRTGATSSP